MNPFISFYTPTFRRPKALAACLASVSAQTIASEIEQIVIPDHVGRGIGGMYAQVPSYVDAVHGRYVHVLSDDEVLVAPDVVERVRAHVEAAGDPPVVVVRLLRDGGVYPWGPAWPPVCCSIGLGCLIVRADVWKAHAHRYGLRYEGDYDFAAALYESGYDASDLNLPFVQGPAGYGRPEAGV